MHFKFTQISNCIHNTFTTGLLIVRVNDWLKCISVMKNLKSARFLKRFRFSWMFHLCEVLLVVLVMTLTSLHLCYHDFNFKHNFWNSHSMIYFGSYLKINLFYKCLLEKNLSFIWWILYFSCVAKAVIDRKAFAKAAKFVYDWCSFCYRLCYFYRCNCYLFIAYIPQLQGAHELLPYSWSLPLVWWRLVWWHSGELLQGKQYC